MKKLLPFYLGIKCFCKKISKFKFIIFLITRSRNITTSQIFHFSQIFFKFFFFGKLKRRSMGRGACATGKFSNFEFFPAHSKMFENCPAYSNIFKKIPANSKILAGNLPRAHNLCVLVAH
jgi:hypothetical protein